MRGKDKCRILKDIRAQIAAKNDIEWVVSECSHKGECRGTCPKCESEVRKLERELELRRKLGKAVAITGVSAACMAGLTACSMEDVVDYAEGIVDNVKDMIRRAHNRIDDPVELDGDVVYIPDELEGYVPADSFDGTDKGNDYICPEPQTAASGDDEIYWLEGEVAIEDWE